MARLVSFLILVLLYNSPASAAAPLRIGLSLGLTGDYALTSEKQHKGYQLFQDDINTAGGVLGRQVAFVIYDNGSHKQTAIAQYERLIVEDKVDFVLGPYTSSLTVAISPVVEKHGYPTLAAGAAADNIWQQGYTNIFGMYTPASRYVLGFLKLIAYHGLDRIVIVTGDGPFAANLTAGARKWARALRLNVLDFISISGQASDFSVIAERVKAAAPTVLICTGHYYIGVAMKKALQQLGWHPRVFYATISPTFQKYFDDLGEATELDFTTAIWEPHPKLNYPGSSAFVKRYEKRFHEPPTYHAASAYAAAEVLVKAIAESGSTDRDVIRTKLRTLNTVSIIGRYAVDSTGVQVKRFPLIIQWQEGRKEIVWPRELQTRPVLFREVP